MLVEQDFGLLSVIEPFPGQALLSDRLKTVTNLCVICTKRTAPQFAPLKLIGLSTTKRIRQVFLTPYQVLGLKLP